MYKLVEDVLKINSAEIEDNKVIRDLIDSVFTDTFFFNRIAMWIYIVFNSMPFLLQLYFPESIGHVGVIICMISALLVESALFVLEIIELKTS